MPAFSWAESWGENGFARIKRGVNLCGIADNVLYPDVVSVHLPSEQGGLRQPDIVNGIFVASISLGTGIIVLFFVATGMLIWRARARLRNETRVNGAPSTQNSKVDVDVSSLDASPLLQ